MSSPVSLIVNMAGPDRPGLVESLSSAISEAGGNWEGSRMARLAGQFAGVVHVVISQDKAEALRSSLEKLKSDDLLISVVEDKGGVIEPDDSAGKRSSLEVVGQDRTGIVKEISQSLAGLGVNVEELSTECLSAPMSGERIFEMDAVVSLPEGISEEQVRDRVEEIAQDLAVTIVDYTE